MIRWKCPECDNGILGLERPRKNDVTRYCLPCSSKKGILVERFAPKLEAQRTAAKQKIADKEKRQRATVANRKAKAKPLTDNIKKATTFGWEGFRIEHEADKIWKLLEPYHQGVRRPRIEVTAKGARLYESGHFFVPTKHVAGVAYISQGKIWLDANPTWEVLAHELVHMAVGVRQGLKNRQAHDKVFYDCLRDVTQRRFKVTISFFTVTRYGYAVDALIQNQLDKTTYEQTWKKS